MRRSLSAWCFVAPALVVITVFFFVPVLAALAMSLTDFDIYALADVANLRVVGLRNYAELLQTPLFWRAFGNTLYFRSYQLGSGFELWRTDGTPAGTVQVTERTESHSYPSMRPALGDQTLVKLLATTLLHL